MKYIHDASVILCKLGKKVDKSGRTALIYASGNGFISTVKVLLENPATEINLETNEGETALNYARSYRNQVVYKLLKDKGAYCKVQTICNMRGVEDYIIKNHGSKVLQKMGNAVEKMANAASKKPSAETINEKSINFSPHKPR